MTSKRPDGLLVQAWKALVAVGVLFGVVTSLYALVSALGWTTESYVIVVLFAAFLFVLAMWVQAARELLILRGAHSAAEKGAPRVSTDGASVLLSERTLHVRDRRRFNVELPFAGRAFIRMNADRVVGLELHDRWHASRRKFGAPVWREYAVRRLSGQEMGHFDAGSELVLFVWKESLRSATVTLEVTAVSDSHP